MFIIDDKINPRRAILLAPKISTSCPFKNCPMAYDIEKAPPISPKASFENRKSSPNRGRVIEKLSLAK